MAYSKTMATQRSVVLVVHSSHLALTIRTRARKNTRNGSLVSK